MEIKLPVKWLNEKCVPIVIGDSWDDPMNTGEVCEHTIDSFNSMLFADTFITSFADRENTGEQPVADWVPVNLGGSNEMLDRETRIASEFKWQRGVFPETETWKPDAKTLMEIYTAEQRAKAIADTYTTNTYTGTGINCDMPIDKPMMITVCGHSDNITPPETNKETKLKLTKDDVGKEFLCNGHIAEVCNISDSAERFVLYTSTDGFIIVNKNGGSCTSDSFQLEQYEPRYWLKDLPDADLFYHDWIACDENGDWFNYECSPPILSDDAYGAGGGEVFCMACIKDLPKLTGDEWKLSKISIDDLREWKRVNKSDQ